MIFYNTALKSYPSQEIQQHCPHYRFCPLKYSFRSDQHAKSLKILPVIEGFNDNTLERNTFT